METINTIYHYCKIKTFIEGILPSKSLLLGLYKNTNDPHENKHFGLTEYYGTVDPNFRLEDYNEVNIHSKIDKIISKKVRLACFSKSNFKNKNESLGYILPRMWALYGENHYGVCIEIDLDIMIKTNSRLFSNKDTFRDSVKYKNKLIFPEIDMKQAKKDQLKYSIKYIKRFNKHLFFQKHNDWSGENEYRLITLGNIKKIDISKCTKKVILGLYTPTIYEGLIKSSFNNIDLYRMEFDVIDRIYFIKQIL
jgi:hypothetical protein